MLGTRFAVLLFSIVAAGWVLAGETKPSRVKDSVLGKRPFRCSGVVYNKKFMGSGTVAYHPKLVVSCAHIAYNGDTEVWLTGNKWVNKWHKEKNPTQSGSTKELRGLWYFAEYGDWEYHWQDFVVFYAYKPLASWDFVPVLAADIDGVVNKNGHPLSFLFYKRLIVGYADDDRYFMNATGPFDAVYQPGLGDENEDWYFMLNEDVQAQSGMDGGGVFVFTNLTDDAEFNYNEMLLSGVHIDQENGDPGVAARGIDSDAEALMAAAAQSADDGYRTVTSTFTSTNIVNIPDSERSFTKQKIKVSGMPKPSVTVLFSLSITHPFRGDLEIKLTSPTGRTTQIKTYDPTDNADDVNVTDLDLTAAMAGQNPNGEWVLAVRDLGDGDEGQLTSVSLTITGRQE